mgnify:CR=1 FL=1
MALVQAKDASAKSMQSMMLDCMEEQQATLVSALERLMGMIGKAPSDRGSSDALAGAITGLKRVMAELPGDLKEALDRQYQTIQAKTMTGEAKPRITVQMPSRLMDRIDSLENALLTGLRRSRSRTFGSNY